jgi:hypothetical protein
MKKTFRLSKEEVIMILYKYLYNEGFVNSSGTVSYRCDLSSFPEWIEITKDDE